MEIIGVSIGRWVLRRQLVWGGGDKVTPAAGYHVDLVESVHIGRWSGLGTFLSYLNVHYIVVRQANGQ